MSNLLSEHSLASEWDYSKNDLPILGITSGSNRKVWWICAKNHSWKASIASRILNGSGCPMCSGRVVITGETDLATTHPEIAKQWHPTKNNGLLPSQVKAGIGHKVWWLGECGHEWQTAPCMRTGPVNQTNCPICIGKTIISGINDLATVAPDLLLEWDYAKNSIDPSKISPGSHKAAWWVCLNGHRWSAQIKTRVKLGYGCLACSSAVSGLEKELREYVESLGVTCVYNTRKLISPLEIDIYCETVGVAIEFNGAYWHSEGAGKDKNYHWNKYNECKSRGVQLIQIWEDDWLYKREVVKEMIRHKLGKSTKYTGARTLEVSRLAVSEARAFLQANHIQGFRGATAHYGLKSSLNGTLLAVMSWSISKGVGEIIRYSALGNVQGGFQKLLSYAVKNSENISKIRSYVDNDYGTGAVYAKAGFTLKSDKIPSYGYIRRGSRKREHRLNYSPSAIAKKSKKDSSIVYHENLTERELAVLNGLTKVWTSGNSLWEKDI
jgi:hypothetical protein